MVDNASSDDSIAMVQSSFPDVQVISNDRNLGFGRAVNRGIAASKGRYITLLNTDAMLTYGAMDILISFMDKHTDTAICGGQLVYEDGRKQHFIR